jgi:rRNA maturation protein Nop10
MERNARDPSVEVENEIFKVYIANADETFSRLGVGWEVQYWTPAFKRLDLNILRKFRTVGVILPLTELKINPDGSVEARGIVNIMEPALNPQYREEVVVARPDGTIERRIELVSSEKARAYAVDKLRAWPSLWLGHPPYVAELMKDYKYCSRCRVYHLTDSVRCPYCGILLRNSPRKKKPVDPTKYVRT